MDHAAFAEDLRRHAGLLRHVAYAYCRDAADRDDVLQEIAVALWRAAPKYDPRFRKSTWIYRIALNVAISFDRRERRHRAGREPLDARVFELAAPTAEPPPAVRLLLDCVAAFDPLDRALVLLHLDGHDHATIAEVLGISASNVGTKLWRLKNRLRAEMTLRADDPREDRSDGL